MSNDDDFSDIIESIDIQDDDDQNTELEIVHSVKCNSKYFFAITVRDLIHSNWTIETIYKALAEMEAFGLKKKLNR